MFASHPFRASVESNTGSLTFKLFASGSNSGYSNLLGPLSTITFNGTSSLNIGGLWLGHNATPNGWTASAGPNLDQFSTGPDILTGLSVPFTNNSEKTVGFNQGKSYHAGDNNSFNIGTNTDMILELIFCSTKVGAGPDNALVGKFNGTGWLIDDNAGVIKFYGITNAGILTPQKNTWYHMFIVCDRDNATTIITNGANGTRVAPLGTNVDVASPLEIGSYSAGTAKSFYNIAYVGIWTGSLGNPLIEEINEVALNRFCRLTGVYPQLAKGRATPNLVSRNSNASLDMVVDETTGERNIFSVGSNWPRVVKRKDQNGQYLTGYLPELQATNNVKSSNNFADVTTWTPATGLALSGNYSSSAAPFSSPFGINTGSTAVYLFGPNGTSRQLFYAPGAPQSLANVSVFFRPNQNGANEITLYQNAVRTTFAFSGDHTNYPVLSYVNGGSQIQGAWAEYYGNKWWRLHASYGGNINGWAFLFNQSGSNTFGNNGDLACWIAGAQHEGLVTNQEIGTSYIETVSGSVTTRNADDLRYELGNNVFTGSNSINFKYLNMVPMNASGSTGSIFMMGLNNTDHVRFNLKDDGGGTFEGRTNNNVQFSIPVLSASLNNGMITSLAGNAINTNASLYRDFPLTASTKTEEGRGLSTAIMPATTGSLYLGSDLAVANKQTNVGIIGDFKIFNKAKIG